jgi:hypothetical protein
MTFPSGQEPPAAVSYGLEDALELLAALEDARDVLSEGDHLSVLAGVEQQVAILNRKLGFDEPKGGTDGV